MKKLIYPALFAVVIISSAFKIAGNVTQWNLNKEAYTVKFTSNKFDCTFKGLKTELNFDANNLAASTIEASIETNTLNTGNGMRNKHAKQGLESDKYPLVKFNSSSISKTATGYLAVGNLTIKDVTKTISIPFTFTQNGEGGTFSGNFSIKPKDYNVTKSGTPEILNIELNVPVTK